MDPLALVAIIGSCLAALVGSIAALVKSKPESAAIVVSAATSLVSSQAGELERLAQAIARLEAANAARDEREAAMRLEIDGLKEDLVTVTHERDEAFLREAVLKTRVGKLEQELKTLKAPAQTEPEA